MSRPGRFTPGNEAVPIVQEAGWAPWPVWTVTETVASTEIRSPDRPVQPAATATALPRPTTMTEIF
jgi:hypothetical protein